MVEPLLSARRSYFSDLFGVRDGDRDSILFLFSLTGDTAERLSCLGDLERRSLTRFSLSGARDRLFSDYLTLSLSFARPRSESLTLSLVSLRLFLSLR